MLNVLSPYQAGKLFVSFIPPVSMLARLLSRTEFNKKVYPIFSDEHQQVQDKCR